MDKHKRTKHIEVKSVHTRKEKPVRERKNAKQIREKHREKLSKRPTYPLTQKIDVSPIDLALSSIQKIENQGTANTRGFLIAQLNKEIRNFIKNPEFENLNLSSKRAISFSDFLSNKFLIVLTIRKGLPYSIFSLIQKVTPYSNNDWADYLDISGKTLIRYKQQDKLFKSIHTEKIIELAEVTNLGVDVFGNNEKFKLWLETPNYALGSLKPFELLRDSYGKEMIIGELTRIEHGILA